MQVSDHKGKRDQGKNGERRIVGKSALSEGIADGKEAFLQSPISVLGLGSRAEKSLLRAGIETVGDLAQKSEEEIKAIEGFGQKAMFQVKWALIEKRISFFTGHEEEPQPVRELDGSGELKKDELLGIPLNSFELSIRTAVVLQNAGIETIGDLAAKTSKEILKIRMAGRRTLKEVKELLGSMGLELADAQEKQKPLDQRGINKLGLFKKIQEALNSVGIVSIADLVKMDEHELGRIRGIGMDSVGRIKWALKREGLCLKSTDDQEEAVSHSSPAGALQNVEIIDSAEDGQEHFISIGALDAETPAAPRKSAEKAPWDEWKGEAYERMGNAELLDTARMHMESEAIESEDAFRASAPALYMALEKRQLCEGLFGNSGLGNDSVGSGTGAETETPDAPGQLSVLAGDAREEVKKLLETLRPEALQATQKLLDKL